MNAAIPVRPAPPAFLLGFAPTRAAKPGNISVPHISCIPVYMIGKSYVSDLLLFNKLSEEK